MIPVETSKRSVCPIGADPQHGIGQWTDEVFIRALSQGVSPDGSDYYPVFPCTSFTAMTAEDMLDLKTHIFSLPPDPTPGRAHDLPPHVQFRPLLAPWKVLNLREGPERPDPDQSPAWNRGRTLICATGHCGECHTPRGEMLPDMLLAGAQDGPDGDSVPNITPHPETGIGRWSRLDLEFLLEIGMLPDSGFVDDSMGEVVDETTSLLSDEDRAAMVEYLLSLPGVENDI